ncbi:hypothetical protein [Nocardioides marmotae]|uniref:hypothetical protein n=1 Tax=Nocardioides marmotae TaxID=2663857 RepID=UPI0012B661FC|nr:hypothetical protein [Nocardioides marmotae]MBC9734117.1 hypothetical protein [Nocardioides marmotae]MTB85220.1 hypothetical protein [Nocardioides marmotae]
MPSGVRALIASLVATAALVGVGVVLSDPQGSSGPAGPTSPTAAPPVALDPDTGLDDLETRGLAAVRGPFCAGIAPAAVEAALGGAPTRAEAYGNGESAALTPRVTDVAHEHGCLWSTGGTTARGWVFAPPVTPARARGLVRLATGGRGCSRVADAPTFGEPGVALVCRRGDVREASYRGLLGDAWVVCSISAPRSLDRAEQLARTSRWCAAVVAATTGAR